MSASAPAASGIALPSIDVDTSLEDAIVRLYRRLMRALVISIAEAALGLAFLVSQAPTLASKGTPPIALMTRTGPFEVAPLRNLAMSDDFIAAWAARTLVDAYAINPIDFQTVLTKVRHRFTSAAWSAFAASYKAGGDKSDLHKLLTEDLTGFAQLTADPVIVHRTFGSDAAFTVAFPMIVTWQNANSLISRRFDVRVVVRRADIARHPSGLAIQKFTALSKGV
jgi:hypothetical protein